METWLRTGMSALRPPRGMSVLQGFSRRSRSLVVARLRLLVLAWKRSEWQCGLMPAGFENANDLTMAVFNRVLQGRPFRMAREGTIRLTNWRIKRCEKLVNRQKTF